MRKRLMPLEVDGRRDMNAGHNISIVMAGLVPAIYLLSGVKDVDPRNKSGDDGVDTGNPLP